MDQAAEVAKRDQRLAMPATCNELNVKHDKSCLSHCCRWGNDPANDELLTRELIDANDGTQPECSVRRTGDVLVRPEEVATRISAQLQPILARTMIISDVQLP
jgi:hypothetical protein